MKQSHGAVWGNPLFHAVFPDLAVYSLQQSGIRIAVSGISTGIYTDTSATYLLTAKARGQTQ